jgi:hypothetical protein
MEVIRDREKRTIILSQASYIRQILARFDFNQSKSRVTPFHSMDVTSCPDGIEAIQLDQNEQKLFQSIVGSLLYAANFTRIDISFITNCLARFMHQATNFQLQAAYHVLRYLVGTIGFALIFRPSPVQSTKNEIIIYSDSDWASQKADRVSVSGVISTVNGSIIHWSSKKQHTVASSTAESELYAISDALNESIYLINWFDFYLKEKITVKILSDSQSAITMADHATDHNRMKHIEIRYFKIREWISSKKISLNYIATAQNIADVLTKALNGPRFNFLRSKLLIDSLNPINVNDKVP